MRLNFITDIKKSGKPCKEYIGIKQYVDTGNVQFDKIIASESYSYSDKPSRANIVVEVGDVLFAKMQNSIKVICVDEANKDYIYSTGFYCLRDDRLLPEYLKYYLLSKEFNIKKDKLCQGATMKAINDDGLKQIDIEVPSIEEQQKIVNIFNSIYSAIKEKKKQINLLDEITKSRFIELFGDPITNSNNLPTERMELRFNLKAGITTAADDIHEFEEGMYEIPCYGGNGIRGYVREKSYTGNYPIIGRQGALCGNVHYATGEFHATEHAVLVSLLKNDNSVWVYHLLKLMDLYRYHTGAAQPGLAVKTLNTIEVIVADKRKQDQFAAFVEQTDKSKLATTETLKYLEELKTSLMTKYFG